VAEKGAGLTPAPSVPDTFNRTPENGHYTFYVDDDSGAEMRIQGGTVIDEDFGRDGSERSGGINLKQDCHEGP
jgi:hypothetical protein